MLSLKLFAICIGELAYEVLLIASFTPCLRNLCTHGAR